jgi:hypothetical protein
MKYFTTNGIALGTVDTMVGPFDFGQFLSVSMEKSQVVAFNDSSFMSLVNTAIRTLHTRILPYASEDFVESYFWERIVGDDIMLGADGQDVPCPWGPCGYLEVWESVLPKDYQGIIPQTFRAEEPQWSNVTGKEMFESFNDLAKHFEKKVHINALLRLAGRCVFITANGMVGLGPAYLQQEDTVSVIHGCRLPLILRQTGQHFRLIGPAYIHGAMHGEFASGKEAQFTLK